MRVTVLCGGESSERDVSVASGLAVARAILERGDDVVVVDPAAESPILAGYSAELPAFAIPAEPPDLTMRPLWRRRMFDALTGGPVLAELRRSDLVFVALHGGWGEDGHVQALLDMAGVPYTGAGSAVCAAAWHKDQALGVLRSAGVPTTDRARYRPSREDVPVEAKRLLDAGPVVVKPAADGSSVAVHLVESTEELLWVGQASPDRDLIIEPFLPGREFTVGVVGEEMLPVVEIELDTPLFDYRAKYQPGAAREICPAVVPLDFAAQLRELGRRGHRALRFGPKAYSRVDFRCDREGRPMCLELNALPGLTPGSLLPLAAKGVGWSYADLIARIIDLAVMDRADRPT